jgi:hypothetical protein
MKPENLTGLSEQELLKKIKKMKTDKIINANKKSRKVSELIYWSISL